VNYRDGTKKDVNTNIATFDIATLPIACKCFDTRYTSDSCTDAQHMDVINGNGTFIGEHCMLIKNDLADGVDENEGIGGLMYVYVPRGNVESIDFNIYGNPNPEHLRISGLSWVKYNEDIKTLTPNGSSNLTVLNSGGFRIYPIEGYTYILKNLADTSISKQLQERINLCKKVQSAEAWYFKDKIFWTKRSITNFYEAKSFCSDSNGIGIDLTGTIPRLAILNDVVGVNSAFLVSTLTNNQDLLWNTTTADGGWVDGSTLKGFWIDYSIGENYYPLQKFDWYYYTGTGVDPGVAEYAPLCAAEINNSRGVTKAMCTSLGITCDKTNGRCTAPDPSSFTAFNSNAYLKTSNPLIEVNIKSVSSGGKAIDSNSVVVWVEGGQLKARYIGENYALYDDQTIESDIIAKDVKGDQYGTLTIIDYINNPED